LRDESARLRDEVATLRDEVAMLRDVASRLRNSEREERDQTRDLGDVAADLRDLDADARDEGAADRDRRAERLERQAGTDTLPLAHARAREAREDAAADRSSAGRDRVAAASERADSGQDRDDSSDDRNISAAELASAGDDRERSSHDRNAAAHERAGAGLDRERSSDDRDAAADDRAYATRDALTGALNRGPGLEAVQRDIDRADRTGEPLTVAFLDVDGLKSINDTGGHLAGDQLLVAVVAAVREQLRPYDAIVRYGGDEFVCSMLGLTADEATVRGTAANATLLVGAHPGSVTVGFAEFRPGDSLADLLERADRALYSSRVKSRATLPNPRP